MKFFKKRLSKNKLTKAFTETTLAPLINDNNKPLPPSPSTPLQQSKKLVPNTEITDSNIQQTNDSWLHLNLPNDFSSSFDIPQLQKDELPSNKLEISSQSNNKTPDQEVENITESSLSSYPDNSISTITCNKVNVNDTKNEVLENSAPSQSLDSSTFDLLQNIEHESQTSSSPLHVEKEGETLNDTCDSSPVLVDAPLILNDDLNEKEEIIELPVDIKSTESDAEEGKEEEEEIVGKEEKEVETDTPNFSVKDLAVGENVDEKDQPILESLKEQDQLATTTLLLENCIIVDQDPSDLLIAEMPSTHHESPQTTTTVISPSILAETQTKPPQPLQVDPSNETVSALNQELQTEVKDGIKVAKRKSAISLIPRKQQPIITEEVHKPTNATTLSKKDRRGSSSSFIPVLTTRYNNNTTNKDMTHNTWSPSSSSELSLERDFVSSGSTSSYCSNHSQQDDKSQEKRTSSIIKSNMIQQQQQQQSKIPKAAFGISIASTEVPKVINSAANPTTTANQQNYVSRLPTKRNSNII